MMEDSKDRRKSMIKIAFFDIDGTILRIGCKELTKKTLLTLKKLKEKGIKICLATGRGYSSVPQFKDIEFDVLLTFNGSYVRKGEQVLFKNPLDSKDKEIIIDNLKNMNRATAISNEHMIVTNGSDEGLEEYFAIARERLIIAKDFDEISKGDIYQIMCACDKHEYEQIIKGTTNTKIVAWWDRAGDIIPVDSGKGNAINKVLEYYGFSKDEAIAFGDGANDIDMLETVGTSVAMGNANDEVKHAADEVCKSVDDDGVYYYCLENGLI
jgi:Cof subfamily protein (haloacid dehalogenase superfamily)